MLYVVLIFIDIICVLLIAVSIPIFFVREMRWAATKLLLTGIGGYIGSALGYLAIALFTFGGSDFPSTPAAKVLWLTLLLTAILVGLGAGVRVGYQLAGQLNRQRGWD